MAGERTFTEGEAYALVADAVERETASAKAEADTLREENTKLKNDNDVLEQRVTAAEEKVGTAEKALEDYKADVEAQKAAEEKRSERLAKVAEVAPALVSDDDKGKERADRIVAMADDAFDEYVGSLRQVADAKPDDGKGDDGKPKTTDDGKPLPRESAAFKGGKTGEGSKPNGSVKELFGARRALTQPAKSA